MVNELLSELDSELLSVLLSEFVSEFVSELFSDEDDELLFRWFRLFRLFRFELRPEAAIEAACCISACIVAFCRAFELREVELSAAAAAIEAIEAGDRSLELESPVGLRLFK